MQNHKYYPSSCAHNRPMPIAQPIMKPDIFENFPLAMAYIPWQNWRNIYDNERALIVGTIFQELDLPFCGKGGIKR